MFQDIRNKLIKYLDIHKTNTLKPIRSMSNAKETHNISCRFIYNNGFTLIEVLVSMLIFGITALSLCYTITGSMDVTSKNQDFITANNCAKEYLEDIGQEWQDPLKFAEGSTVPIQMSSEYNPDDKFVVTVNNPTTMVTDEKGIAIVRRVRVTYRTIDNKPLVDMSMDYNKTGLSTEKN